MAYVTNPFQNLELEIPEAYRGEVDRFCQTQPGGGARPSPDDSPFERQIDIWFMAACIGVRKGKRTKVVKSKSHRFAYGELLSRDPYRIECLELLAVSYTDDPWILERPSEIIDLANELAATGLAEIIDMLKGGSAKPIWNLTDSLVDMFSDVTKQYHSVG